MVNFGGFWLNADVQYALLDSYKSNRGYRTPRRVPALVLRPFIMETPERRAAVQRAAELEATPQGANAQVHRQEQVDGTASKIGKAAARLRRKVRARALNLDEVTPQGHETWFNQYETIKTNSDHGRAAEEQVLEAFNVDSNNVGETVLFDDDTNDNSGRRRRPDGLGFDDEGQAVVVEVKRKKTEGVVYATQQLRTEEAAARDLNGRHVVVIHTAATVDEGANFPRPSRGFKDLSTEFRLVTSDGFVFRWDDEQSDWSIVE